MPREINIPAANPVEFRAAAGQLAGRRLTGLQGRSPEEVRRMLHELEVHQVELEMQHEALREPQQRLEASRDQYADLYDLAPVGYVTLNAKGVIRQINFTAARLLGPEPSQLVGRRFSAYSASGHRRPFRSRLGQSSAGSSRTSCETLLLRLFSQSNREVGIHYPARVGKNLTAGSDVSR
jgi:PAS domain-containing protein